MAEPPDALARYREKRDFERTPEPAGAVPAATQGWSFCVQQHAARRLHYDFRLELDGVLKSWAIPKGPSLVPGEKRMAVATEDHPVEYGAFEGVIAEGEYGGGTVLLWDRGTWSPIGDPRQGLATGKLQLVLHGEKLRGKFRLIRLKSDDAWLLLKSRDEHATSTGEIVEAAPKSVASGRTIDEIAAQDGASAKQLARARAIAGHGPSATDARAPAADEGMPAFVQPQLATLVDTAPEGDSWIHEIKLDGFRIQCRVDGEHVTLTSRNGLDWTARAPAVVEAARALDCTRALLDGELCWLDPDGRTSLAGDRGGPVYFAFDLLFVDDRDLRSLPVVERRRELARLCLGAPPVLRCTEHRRGKGGELFAEASARGLEGIVSKRADAPYRSGRGRDWLKVKCLMRQEFVIVGWTPPTHARDRFGALVLAIYDDGACRRGPDALLYAGRVGTGFDRSAREAIWARLEPLAQPDCPLTAHPRAPGLARVHWVAPHLVGEVAFMEWTSDGRLRHPSFQGLRDDKPATAVRRER